jgi:hypothetical protein
MINLNFTMNSVLKITYVPSLSLIKMLKFQKICKYVHIYMLMLSKSEVLVKRFFVFLFLLKLYIL